jgi:EAL domain-containing protein (putative c-di-GMP-specific phosphodiesterase class I)
VAHVGADEFVVVLEGRSAVLDDVRVLASRLETAIGEPIRLGDDEVFLSASIGVAVNDGPTPDGASLLQQADAALYRAKAHGRNCLVVFDEAMRAGALHQLRVDRDLRAGIERSELELHFQPEIDLRTGRLVGAEALLRWRHPVEGLLLPDSFISVAEENGTIVRIGRWVVEESVRLARSWADAFTGGRPFLIAVNLSARQLRAADLVEHIAGVLDRHSWPAPQLVLELTESVLIDDRDLHVDVLYRLKALGVQLAIDDFGTGYSSLSYLHRFPVDIVKIDRSFVSGLCADGSGSPLASAVLHMAHALGLTAAAEGVETEDQLAGLRRLDCDLAQGFHFSKPLTPEAFERLVADPPSW